MNEEEGGKVHQAQDNKAHLAFFDLESDISFVWNGTQGRTVDVCMGGYGEPVSDRFELPFNPLVSSLATTLRRFEFECKAYLAVGKENLG